MYVYLLSPSGTSSPKQRIKKLMAGCSPPVSTRYYIPYYMVYKTTPPSNHTEPFCFPYSYHTRTAYNTGPMTRNQDTGRSRFIFENGCVPRYWSRISHPHRYLKLNILWGYFLLEGRYDTAAVQLIRCCITNMLVEDSTLTP